MRSSRAGTAPSTDLRTERLWLRPWRSSDREPFARLNADPRVMEYFPAPLSRGESVRLADQIQSHIDQYGWGLWAVEIPGVAPFGGFIGLAIPHFEAPFMPCTEIGWRLDPDHWGHGYATEGARAILGFAFHTLGLDEIVSFTTAANHRSRRVMERIGMVRDPTDDFDHPSLPVGHVLRSHVLYRIRKADSAAPQPANERDRA
jgi:RimJ/RimL family protein N-acetyltransferase